MLLPLIGPQYRLSQEITRYPPVVFKGQKAGTWRVLPGGIRYRRPERVDPGQVGLG